MDSIFKEVERERVNRDCCLSFDGLEIEKKSKNSGSFDNKESKEVLFKTEKIRKISTTIEEKKIHPSTRKRKNTRENRKQLKLIRNRISAKKSRIKKKAYIQNLEEKIEELETQIQKLKLPKFNENNNGSKLDEKISYLETMSLNYIRLMSDAPFSMNLNFAMEGNSKIKTEYQRTQTLLSFELFKSLVKSLTPLEIKYFEVKLSILKDYNKSENIHVFLETILENQFLLNEIYSFHFASDATVSFPFHVYMFYEQIKKIAIEFKSSTLRNGN
jgi:hypothetical protein